MEIKRICNKFMRLISITLNSMNNMHKLIIYSILILGVTPKSNAQITKTHPPAPAAGVFVPHLPYPQVPQPQVPTLQSMVNEQQQRVQQQNNALMQEATTFYEQRQQQAKSIIDESVKENQMQTIQYELPDKSQTEETKLFRNAFNSVDSMLNGKQDLSLKKAVFDSENAWYGGTLNYEYFCTDIANMVDIIKTAIKQEKYSADDDMAKKWILHRFMSDTLRLKDAKGNTTFTHLPYVYDMDDPFGKPTLQNSLLQNLCELGKVNVVLCLYYI